MFCLQIYVFVIVVLWFVKWFFAWNTDALVLVASCGMLLFTFYDLVLYVQALEKAHP